MCFFFFAAPVNEKETLLKPQGQGVWAGGLPVDRGGDGGALFDLFLGV